MSVLRWVAVALLAVACNQRPSPGGGEPPPPSQLGAQPGSAPAASTSAQLPATRQSSGAPQPAAKPEPTRRNVLFITVDSLRADVPWLGYARPIAPNLTKLAEGATVYTRAYSGSSYTAKSVATFLSGRYPSTLYRDRRFFTRYPDSNRFLAEILGEHGVRSFSWHGHMYFGRESGFEQGFAEWRLVSGLEFDSETDNSITSDKLTKLGIELLSSPANTSGPFFAWVHYMDPHDQYLKHAEAPDFGKKARDRYDSEVWFTDFWIGKLLDFARQQPWWQNTVVAVSADHGEAFGEHGMYKHAFELWEVLTHVPLFFAGPGVRARRIDARRSHIDLAPTFLELSGAPVPADMQGKSLVPELLGAEPDVREPILLELAEDSHNPPRRAMIADKWKLIDFGRGKYELYDLAADPGETTNVAAKYPDDLAAMKKVLAARYETLPTIAPFGGGKLREGGKADGPKGP